MSSLAVTRAVLAAAVPNAGTITVPYPTGTNQAGLIGTTGGDLVVNNNDRYLQGTSGVRVEYTFNPTNITVTNQTGVAWPINAEVIVAFGVSDDEGRYHPGVKLGPSLVALAPAAPVTDCVTRINEIITVLKASGLAR